MPVCKKNAVFIVTNRQLYCIGGVADRKPTASVEKLCLASGTWSVLASMTRARTNHTALFVPRAKRIMVLGGDGMFAESEWYDLALDTWTDGPRRTSRFKRDRMLVCGDHIVAVTNERVYSIDYIVWPFDKDVWTPLKLQHSGQHVFASSCAH